MLKTLHIETENEMYHLGQSLALNLKGGFVIYLQGNLGAGKTTLVRGILHALGHEGNVKSPTFTLVEPYEIGDKKVYHFDLYRIDSIEELEFIGFRDYLNADSICLIEWPEKAVGYLPKPNIKCDIEISGSRRIVHIENKATEKIPLIQK
jgi:tRNA threonylcarbamoyladenosine biosynthesis protein TsaE